MRIAESIVTVREKEMRAGAGIVGVDRTGRLPHGKFLHPVKLVDAGEVRTTDRFILIQQKPAAENAPIGVERDRLFQVTNCSIELVFLSVLQRKVELRGGIVCVESDRPIQLTTGTAIVTRIAPRLSKVAAEKGTVRLQSRRGLQVLTAALGISFSEAGEAAPEPRGAERRIERNRALEGIASSVDPVFGAKQEAGESSRVRVARGQLPAFLEDSTRFADPSKAKLQLRKSRPDEPAFGRKLRRLPRRLARRGWSRS